ncbi:MAG: alpha/beta fold hydrolase [bacterium]
MPPAHGRLPVACAVLALVAAGIPALGSPAAQAAPDGAPEAVATWEDCGDWLPSGSTCGTLTVPRDWADPGDMSDPESTYRLALARIPAEKPRLREGILTFNPGGPGSSGYENILWIQSLLPQEVRDRFDIVAFDPRGVGGSEPEILGCKVAALEPPATGPVDWEAWVDEYVDAHEDAAEECLALNAEHAGNVGTWQVVRDLDALRAALGEERISFIGQSYGTTVGRAYAQAFPDRVGRLVLDGNVSPRSTIRLWAWEHTWDDRLAIETALDALGPRYPALYREVMSALDMKSIRHGGDRITRFDVGKRLLEWASFHSTWPSMGVLLDTVDAALAAKDPEERRATAAAVAGTVGDEPTVRNWLPPLYTYVNCADFPDRPDRDYLVWVTRTAELIGGVHAAQAALREGAQCAGVPALGQPLEPRGPTTLATPPLVVNSLADNRTPWTAAAEMAAAFPGSRTVMYDGAHHIAFGRTTPCVDAPVDRYLSQGRLPASRVDCPLEWQAD